MTRDPIFSTLTPESLSQIAAYMHWNPIVCDSPVKVLCECSNDERLKWLDDHRSQLENHISWVGTPIFSYAFGNARSYREILRDFAAQLGMCCSAVEDSAKLESQILQKLWAEALDRLTSEQKEILLSKARSVAEQYSPKHGKEIIGFVGLTAAQLSGFGVYVLGSTLLGAVNSVLGLGLGFGVFTGLSSLISLAIGPVGWAALGLYTIKKLGGANYRKLLPVIILIAIERAGGITFSDLLKGSQNPELPSVQRCSIASYVPPLSAHNAAAFFVAKPSIRTVEERTLPKPTLIRVYSKAEKTWFQLRPENRELCSLTDEFTPGRHFLDLSAEEQQFIRDYVNVVAEEKKEAATIAAVAAKEKRRQRKCEEREERALKKQKRRFEMKAQKRAKEYSRLLRNLEFHPDALKRLELAERSERGSQIDEALGLMNVGRIIYRDSIEGTEPKVYETKAGWDYRIYFYSNGQKTYIRLIGDKDTQTADLEILRRGSPSSLKRVLDGTTSDFSRRWASGSA